MSVVSRQLSVCSRQFATRIKNTEYRRVVRRQFLLELNNQYPITNIQVERKYCQETDFTRIKYPMTKCKGSFSVPIPTHTLTHSYVLTFLRSYVLTFLWSPKPLNVNEIPFKVRRRLTFSPNTDHRILNTDQPGMSSLPAPLISISPNLSGPPDNISSEACSAYLKKLRWNACARMIAFSLYASASFQV